MVAEWSGCRIERIFRVQTVKLVGLGLSSTSPEKRRKARRKKLRQSIHLKVCLAKLVGSDCDDAEAKCAFDFSTTGIRTSIIPAERLHQLLLTKNSYLTNLRTQLTYWSQLDLPYFMFASPTVAMQLY